MRKFVKVFPGEILRAMLRSTVEATKDCVRGKVVHMARGGEGEKAFFTTDHFILICERVIWLNVTLENVFLSSVLVQKHFWPLKELQLTCLLFFCFLTRD